MREREVTAAKERTLRRLCHVLVPLLAADPKASAAKRRGQLSEAVRRVCEDNRLKVSSALAWVIVSELENLGAVSSYGRELAFDAAGLLHTSGDAAPARDSCSSLQKLTSELEALEALAQERLDRRKKRQKAREQGRMSKRRRLNEDDE